MSRSWRLFLQDMLVCVRKVESFTSDLSFAQFVADDRTRDAVFGNLELLGEAAKKIPEGVQIQHPEIDWRGVAGLRDVLAHSYFALEDATLWRIVREDLQRIAPELERIARANPPLG